MKNGEERMMDWAGGVGVVESLPNYVLVLQRQHKESTGRKGSRRTLTFVGVVYEQFLSRVD
jgi:hypothetical protein